MLCDIVFVQKAPADTSNVCHFFVNLLTEDLCLVRARRSVVKEKSYRPDIMALTADKVRLMSPLSLCD